MTDRQTLSDDFNKVLNVYPEQYEFQDGVTDKVVPRFQLKTVVTPADGDGADQISLNITSDFDDSKHVYDQDKLALQIKDNLSVVPGSEEVLKVTPDEVAIKEVDTVQVSAETGVEFKRTNDQKISLGANQLQMVHDAGIDMSVGVIDLSADNITGSKYDYDGGGFGGPQQGYQYSYTGDAPPGWPTTGLYNVYFKFRGYVFPASVYPQADNITIHVIIPNVDMHYTDPSGIPAFMNQTDEYVQNALSKPSIFTSTVSLAPTALNMAVDAITETCDTSSIVASSSITETAPEVLIGSKSGDSLDKGFQANSTAVTVQHGASNALKIDHSVLEAKHDTKVCLKQADDKKVEVSATSVTLKHSDEVVANVGDGTTFTEMKLVPASALLKAQDDTASSSISVTSSAVDVSAENTINVSCDDEVLLQAGAGAHKVQLKQGDLAGTYIESSAQVLLKNDDNNFIKVKESEGITLKTQNDITVNSSDKITSTATTSIDHYTPLFDVAASSSSANPVLKVTTGANSVCEVIADEFELKDPATTDASLGDYRIQSNAASITAAHKTKIELKSGTTNLDVQSANVKVNVSSNEKLSITDSAISLNNSSINVEATSGDVTIKAGQRFLGKIGDTDILTLSSDGVSVADNKKLEFWYSRINKKANLDDVLGDLDDALESSQKSLGGTTYNPLVLNSQAWLQSLSAQKQHTLDMNLASNFQDGDARLAMQIAELAKKLSFLESNNSDFAVDSLQEVLTQFQGLVGDGGDSRNMIRNIGSEVRALKKQYQDLEASLTTLSTPTDVTLQGIQELYNLMEYYFYARVNPAHESVALTVAANIQFDIESVAQLDGDPMKWVIDMTGHAQVLSFGSIFDNLGSGKLALEFTNPTLPTVTVMMETANTTRVGEVYTLTSDPASGVLTDGQTYTVQVAYEQVTVTDAYVPAGNSAEELVENHQYGIRQLWVVQGGSELYVLQAPSTFMTSRAIENKFVDLTVASGDEVNADHADKQQYVFAVAGSENMPDNAFAEITCLTTDLQRVTIRVNLSTFTGADGDDTDDRRHIITTVKNLGRIYLPGDSPVDFKFLANLSSNSGSYDVQFQAKDNDDQYVHATLNMSASPFPRITSIYEENAMTASNAADRNIELYDKFEEDAFPSGFNAIHSLKFVPRVQGGGFYNIQHNGFANAGIGQKFKIKLSPLNFTLVDGDADYQEEELAVIEKIAPNGFRMITVANEVLEKRRMTIGQYYDISSAKVVDYENCMRVDLTAHPDPTTFPNAGYGIPVNASSMFESLASDNGITHDFGYLTDANGNETNVGFVKHTENGTLHIRFPSFNTPGSYKFHMRRGNQVHVFKDEGVLYTSSEVTGSSVSVTVVNGEDDGDNSTVSFDVAADDSGLPVPAGMYRYKSTAAASFTHESNMAYRA